MAARTSPCTGLRAACWTPATVCGSLKPNSRYELNRKLTQQTSCQLSAPLYRDARNSLGEGVLYAFQLHNRPSPGPSPSTRTKGRDEAAERDQTRAAA